VATLIQIADIAQHAGQEVTVRGWVYNRTDKGRLQFLLVRDGTGIAQCVAFKKELDPATFETIAALTQESSVVVTGAVRADERAPGTPGGYEIGITALEVIQQADEYPIQPKEHGVEFLMDNRHLWVRSLRQWAILRIRATIIRTIRNWLDDHGYLLVDTPILTPAAGRTPRPCSRSTISASRRFWRRPASFTTRRISGRSARSIASGRPSAPRNRRRAAI